MVENPSHPVPPLSQRLEHMESLGILYPIEFDESADSTGGASGGGGQIFEGGYMSYAEVKDPGRGEEAGDEGESVGPLAQCRVRVVRSLGLWSGGQRETQVRA